MASHHYNARLKQLSMLLLACLLLSLVGVRPAAAARSASPTIDQAANAPEPEAPVHDHSTHSHASEPAGNLQQIAAQSLAQMSANQTAAVPAWHNALSTPEGNAASTDLDPIYPPSSNDPPQVIAGINVSNPVILGDTLYIVQQISDDLHLRAFDLATGAFKWRLPVVGNRMVMTPSSVVDTMWNGLTSSDSSIFTFSLVELGNVYSQATVSAFDPVTRTERWHTQLHPQGDPLGFVYYNNSVYATYRVFNTPNMYLAQIDAATGAVQKTIPLPAANAPISVYTNLPIIVGDKIMLCVMNAIQAYSLELAPVTIPDSASTCGHSNAFQLYGDASGQTIYSVSSTISPDAFTLEKRPLQPAPLEQIERYTFPGYVENNVVIQPGLLFGSPQRFATLASPRTCEEQCTSQVYIWEGDNPTPTVVDLPKVVIDANLSLSKNILYYAGVFYPNAGSNDQGSGIRVGAIDLNTKRILWHYDYATLNSEHVVSPPALVGNTIVVVHTTNILLFHASATPSGCPGDSDCDTLPNGIELLITKDLHAGYTIHLDPNNPDTDGDGLLDGWEADPKWGGGFDNDRNGTIDLTRDQVFGPFDDGRQAGTDKQGEYVSPFPRFNRAPDPFHKDLYMELDWQNCDFGGCPGDESIAPNDPAHHAPSMAALMDVIATFAAASVPNPDGRPGINLNILIDEEISHVPTCDQDVSAARAVFFGTKEQRQSAEHTAILMTKRPLVRYIWSGHSTAEDNWKLDANAGVINTCASPSFGDILTGAPLPQYDWSSFGETRIGGEDILVSLGPMWVCPSWVRDPVLGTTVCFGDRSPITKDPSTDGPKIIGIFPATIEGIAMDFPLPMNLLLGLSEKEGIRQIWGRALMRLIGQSLGLSAEEARNRRPDQLAYRDSNGSVERVPVESYATWGAIKYLPVSGGQRALQVFPGYNEVLAADPDGDGIVSSNDNCSQTPNPTQDDFDGDGFGDLCDSDRDGDGIPNDRDTSPRSNHSSKETPELDATEYDLYPDDSDNDGVDNAVDSDDDNDSIADTVDNCPITSNTDQLDTDQDDKGDACDMDADGDTVETIVELNTGSSPTNAASTPEFLGYGATCGDGLDNDLDGTIDTADQACVDTDGDTIPDLSDNCDTVASPSWADTDHDGIGDACDPTPFPPNSAPSASIAPTFKVNEGAVLTMEATASDPEAQDLDFVWDLNGDGTYGATGQPMVYEPADLEHDGPSVHTMALQVRDPWGLAADATTTVTVVNLPPVIMPLTVTQHPSASGTAVTVTADFSDAGILDDHSGVIDWGDVTTPVDLSEYHGSGTITGTHTYAAPGTYTIELSITDDDGATQTRSAQVVILAASKIAFASATSTVNESAGQVVVTVQLSQPVPSPVSVAYATSNIEAAAGNDYTATSATLVIPANAASGTITVPIREDSALEGPEAFRITLSSPSNATMGSQAIHTVTIAPNDSLTISPAATTVQENAGSVALTVNLNAPSAQTVTVAYVVGGSASAGSDYSAPSVPLTFSPGQTSRPLNITINDDTLSEPAETIVVTLSSPSNAGLGSPASSTITIGDNDIGDVHINVGATSASTLTGVAWQADQYFDTGVTDNYSTLSINRTEDDAMYQQVRTSTTGVFNYAIPASRSGLYQVRLHFAEPYWGTPNVGGGVSSRVFSVKGEKTMLLSNLDVYKEVGASTALVKEFYLPVTDGTLNLNFAATTDRPIASGIEVIYLGPVPSNLPLLQRINAGATGSDTVNGVVWQPDTYFTGGSIRDYGIGIDYTDDDLMYRKVRTTSSALGSFSYALPASQSGLYRVRLYFTEPYWGITGPGMIGSRVFNVNLEHGASFLTNFDILKEVGPAAPLMKEFYIPVNDGVLNLNFSATADTPIISGIDLAYAQKLPTTPGTVVRLNVGATAASTLSGVTWQADQYFDTGVTDNWSTVAINGTADVAMYQHVRTSTTGVFNYAIPAPAVGMYLVRLHFAEPYWGVGSVPGGNGRRVFSVKGEQTISLLNNLDIAKEVGPATALVKEFYLPVTDGTLNLNFAATADRPIASGIEVIYVGPTTNATTLRINAGSSTTDTVNSVVWQADTYSVGGLMNDSGIAINNTLDDMMYRKTHTGTGTMASFAYAIPVATPGLYKVRLHFAETYWGVGSVAGGNGKRVFNIGLETTPGLNNVDIYKEAGVAAALAKEFYIPVTDGTLSLNFVPTVHTPTVSGIEVQLIR